MIYKVIDNFLNDKTFYNYYKLLMSETTMWAWQNEANSDSKNKDLNEQILFGHMLVGDYQWAYDDANKFVDPIMLEIKKRNPDDKFEVRRAKMNLIIRNDKPVKYGLHFDLEKINGRVVKDYETIIFYVNNNNGGTGFENGEFVQQKANRALFIYGRALHQTIGQTDEKRRVNVNINYERNKK